MFRKLNSLEPFFNEPLREFSIREYARLIKVSPATAMKYLQKFEEEGLIKSKNERNLVLYRANSDAAGYKDLKLYHNIKKIRKAGLIEFINEGLNYPEAIILFGSFRKAENTKESDIDIFILSSAKKELKLEKFEKKLGHKIQIFVYSKKELELMKKNNKELLNNILNGTIISGFIEVFNGV